MQGRKKLKVDWDDGPHATFDSDAFKTALLETARKPRKVARNLGNVDARVREGRQGPRGRLLRRRCSPHAAMEPPAAVAEFKDGKVDVWSPRRRIRRPCRTRWPAALGIDKKTSTCHVTLLGGGFGRKSKPDYAAEAALLSKKLGKPVKVVWTREDDIHFDFYHTSPAMYMKAAVDAKGKPTAWLQRSVFPPIASTFDSRATNTAPRSRWAWA